MKKQHLLGIAILVLGLLVAALLLNRVNENAGNRSIVLAALVPATGPSADFGQDDREAITLAAKHFQADNPQAVVTLDFQDTKSDKGTAVTALNAVLAKERPHVVFVESSGASLAILPIVNQNKLLTISVAAHPDVTKNSPYLFRCLPTAKQESEVVLNHTVNDLGLKKVGLLYVNTDYGKSYISPFQESLSSLGGRLVISEAYDAAVSDFRSICTKVAASATDAVFVVGYGKGMGILMRQLREQGFAGQILATSGVVYPEVLAEAGSAADGLKYADVPFRAHPTNRSAARFAKDYKETFGRSPTPFSSTVYDGIVMALGAISEANRDVESAVHNLVKAGIYAGVNGEIGITADRDLIFGLEINTIKR